jgi:excisionase family DNA binding protein
VTDDLAGELSRGLEIGPIDQVIDALADRVAERVCSRLAQIGPEPDNWLDITQAAAHLGLHQDTVRKRAKAGAIPYEQDGVGCRIYFRRSDLDRWRLEGGASTAIGRLADVTDRRLRHASMRLP